MTFTRTRPLRCLLTLHRYRKTHAEDGSLYVACARCGREGPNTGDSAALRGWMG